MNGSEKYSPQELAEKVFGWRPHKFYGNGNTVKCKHVIAEGRLCGRTMEEHYGSDPQDR